MPMTATVQGAAVRADLLTEAWIERLARASHSVLTGADARRSRNRAAGPGGRQDDPLD